MIAPDLVARAFSVVVAEIDTAVVYVVLPASHVPGVAADGFDPLTVKQIVAPEVEVVSVTGCVPEYVPVPGEAFGVATVPPPPVEPAGITCPIRPLGGVGDCANSAEVIRNKKKAFIEPLSS